MTRRHGDRERGAAAVEFALVVPILLVLVFGIIDYGLYFSDAISSRDGARQAARSGAVAPETEPGCDGSADTAALVACDARALADPLAGTVYIAVNAPGGWTAGQPLVVCTLVRVGGVTGLTPLPNGGVVRSVVEMSLENDNGTGPTSFTDTGLPGGLSWDAPCV